MSSRPSAREPVERAERGEVAAVVAGERAADGDAVEQALDGRALVDRDRRAQLARHARGVDARARGGAAIALDHRDRARPPIGRGPPVHGHRDAGLALDEEVRAAASASSAAAATAGRYGSARGSITDAPVDEPLEPVLADQDDPRKIECCGRGTRPAARSRRRRAASRPAGRRGRPGRRQDTAAAGSSTIAESEPSKSTKTAAAVRTGCRAGSSRSGSAQREELLAADQDHDAVDVLAPGRPRSGTARPRTGGRRRLELRRLFSKPGLQATISRCRASCSSAAKIWYPSTRSLLVMSPAAPDAAPVEHQDPHLGARLRRARGRGARLRRAGGTPRGRRRGPRLPRRGSPASRRSLVDHLEQDDPDDDGEADQARATNGGVDTPAFTRSTAPAVAAPGRGHRAHREVASARRPAIRTRRRW